MKINIPNIEKLPLVKISKKQKEKISNGNNRQTIITRLTNKEIPKKPGIYLLYNKEKQLIYIGQTKNL